MTTKFRGNRIIQAVPTVCCLVVCTQEIQLLLGIEISHHTVSTFSSPLWDCAGVVHRLHPLLQLSRGEAQLDVGSNLSL